MECNQQLSLLFDICNWNEHPIGCMVMGRQGICSLQTTNIFTQVCESRIGRLPSVMPSAAGLMVIRL